jgi:hypothetical protein
MRTQASPTLDSSTVAARLGMCAAALAGAAAPMSDANAVVVTFSTPISVPNNFDGIYLNLLTGANGTTGASVAGWDFNPYNSGTSLSFFWSATPSQASGVASTTTGPYLDLAPGSSISSGSTFAQVTATAATAAFQTVGTHTLGFRFYNENTAAINYGYMTLTSDGTTGFPLTITGWSFENSGAAITVSSVPEPATGAMLTMGALALGALNLRRLRRQRRQLAS